jgi:hypothetical protein
MSSALPNRRAFLARIGLLGVVAGSGLALPTPARAAPLTQATQASLADLLRPLMDELARDTFNAFAVFVVPGNDVYSRAQGTPRTEPGALEARTPDFLMAFFDNYIPFPAQLTSAISSALANGLADVPIQPAGGLPILPPGLLGGLDDVVRLLLRTPATLPLSLIIALLLNVLATQVNPRSAHGALGSPFARLSAAEKAEAFRLLEGPNADLVAAIERQLPEPLRGSVSGLLRFLAGSLLELAAFGTYSEWSTFDRNTRSVRRRPIGWDISGFNPGCMDGWNDFKGYYQGRKEVSA